MLHFYLFSFSKKILIVLKIVKLIITKCLVWTLRDWFVWLELRKTLSLQVLLGMIWIPIACMILCFTIFLFLFFGSLFMQIEESAYILLIRKLFCLALSTFLAVLFIFMLSMASSMLFMAFWFWALSALWYRYFIRWWLWFKVRLIIIRHYKNILALLVVLTICYFF